MISTFRSSRALSLTCMLLLAAVATLSMARLFRAEFSNWDDPHTITENALFAPPTLHSLGEIWTQPLGHLYIPVTYSVWWLVARSSSILHAGEFHALNIFLHALSALAVFALLRRLLGIGDRSVRVLTIALAGATLFAAHPVQVESVGWCSGTKDVLCGLFSALTLVNYLAYAQAIKSNSSRNLLPEIRRRATRRYLVTIACLCLAILSKPTAMVLPLMAMAIEWCVLKRTRAAIWRGIIPMLLIAIAGAIEARHFQIAQNLTTLVSPIERIPVALDAIAFYLWKLIAPFALTFDYGRTPKFVMQSGAWRWTIFVPIIVGAVVWKFLRRMPLLFAGAIIFLCGLLPVLGISKFDFQEYSTVADHYLYLPMIGVAIALAGVLNHVRSRRSLAVAGNVVVLILVLLIIRTVDQTQYWMSSKAIMLRAIDINPKSWAAFTNYGEALLNENRLDDALLAEKTALELRPANPDAHLNLGAILLERGDLIEATREFETAIAEQPSDEAYVNLANAYGQARRFDDAITAYKKALNLKPRDPKAKRMLERTEEYLRSRQPASAPSR